MWGKFFKTKGFAKNSSRFGYRKNNLGSEMHRIESFISEQHPESMQTSAAKD